MKRLVIGVLLFGLAGCVSAGMGAKACYHPPKAVGEVDKKVVNDRCVGVNVGTDVFTPKEQ